MQNAQTSKFAAKSLLVFSFTLLAIQPAGRIAAAENAALEGRGRFALNRTARIFVNNYIRENKEILQAIRLRSKTPFTMIDGIFTRYGLPKEVKYLAVIESELKSTALSPVGARGPWQLMPQTAQILGLQVDSSQDERIGYYKSTVAAAKYLKDLYGEFGDWLLVVAAYNGGPAQVYRAIRKSGSRSFWDLQAFLPAESRMHVKKFIATHYYFEGKGSVATATRAECLGCTPQQEIARLTAGREASAGVAGPGIHIRHTPASSGTYNGSKAFFQPAAFKPSTLPSTSSSSLFL